MSIHVVVLAPCFALCLIEPSDYLQLYTPALDWIVQCIAFKSPEVRIIVKCGRVRQDRTGQDRTGQDRTGQDRATMQGIATQRKARKHASKLIRKAQ